MTTSDKPQGRWMSETVHWSTRGSSVGFVEHVVAPASRGCEQQAGSHRVQWDAEGVVRRQDPLARHRLQAQQARCVPPVGDVVCGWRGRRRSWRRLLRWRRGLPASCRLCSAQRRLQGQNLHSCGQLTPGSPGPATTQVTLVSLLMEPTANLFTRPIWSCSHHNPALLITQCNSMFDEAPHA